MQRDRQVVELVDMNLPRSVLANPRRYRSPDILTVFSVCIQSFECLDDLLHAALPNSAVEGAGERCRIVPCRVRRMQLSSATTSFIPVFSAMVTGTPQAIASIGVYLVGVRDNALTSDSSGPLTASSRASHRAGTSPAPSRAPRRRTESLARSRCDASPRSGTPDRCPV